MRAAAPQLLIYHLLEEKMKIIASMLVSCRCRRRHNTRITFAMKHQIGRRPSLAAGTAMNAYQFLAMRGKAINIIAAQRALIPDDGESMIIAADRGCARKRPARLPPTATRHDLRHACHQQREKEIERLSRDGTFL